MPYDAAYRERTLQIAGEDCHVTFCNPETDGRPTQKALAQAEIILGDLEQEEFRYTKKLKFMQCTWAGVDHYVDCFPHGACLCNMSGAYGVTIAEHEMALILALSRRIPAYYMRQVMGRWQTAGPEKTLEGASALILGAGNIGIELAERLRPFVRTIIGVRRTVRSIPAEFDGMITLDDLDQYLPQVDLVACSLPSTPQTRHLFNKQRLLRMKRDALLINVGRGDLIVSDDLADVLEEGHLFGVGIDVTEPEPLPAGHKLWRQKQLLITPHISGNAFAPGSPTERRIWDFVLHNFQNYLTEVPVENVVDYSAGYRKLQ